MGGQGSGRPMKVENVLKMQQPEIPIATDGKNAFILPNYSGVQQFAKQNEDILEITNDGTKTTLLGKGGDYLRIGDANTTSGSVNLVTNDDLLVTGRIEVSGAMNLGTGLTTNETLTSYGNNGVYLSVCNGLDDGVRFCLREVEDRSNNNMIITTWTNRNKDHDHSTASTNPTLFIHSATDPDSDNTQYISISHDQTNGVIATGKGDLYLNPAGGEIKFGTYTAGAATDSTGYITIVDSGGTTRKLMVQA